MKRIKGIDTIRGLCILLMILGHLIDWWIRIEDRWLINILFAFLAPIAATGFMFISGFSAILSYQRKVTNIEESNGLTMRKVKNIYLIRASLLLIVALLYNTAIAFGINDPTWIWAWNVLQTIAVSLLLGCFFLNTSKTFRILVGIVLLVGNQFISPFLLLYEGQTNLYGLLFYILYHPLEQFTILLYEGQTNLYGLLFYILYHPLEQFTILSYFSIFLIGTVVGDSFFKVSTISDQEERKHAIKYVFLMPLTLIGIISVSFSFIFRFPDIIFRRTFSSHVFSIGFFLILLSILLYIEEFEVVKTKKSYRFFYYYSFYSFTIYLAHDPLYFIFFRQLNAFTIWIAFVGTIILITLLLKSINEKWGRKASLKTQLSILSLIILNKIEQKESKNN